MLACAPLCGTRFRGGRREALGSRECIRFPLLIIGSVLAGSSWACCVNHLKVSGVGKIRLAQRFSNEVVKRCIGTVCVDEIACGAPELPVICGLCIVFKRFGDK